jgi:hypothetical protein
MAKVACQMCGEQPAVHQWSSCANGHRYVAVCLDCDFAVNEILLAMLRLPHRAKLMAAYRAKQKRLVPTNRRQRP